MPDSVQITDVECGDTIDSPFTLGIEYCSQNASKIAVSAAGAVVTPLPQPMGVAPVTAPTPAAPSPILTYAAPPVTGATISVTLLDSTGKTLATDSVSGITVSSPNNPPIHIISPAPTHIKRGPYKHFLGIKSGSPLQGTFDANLGTDLTLLIESRVIGRVHWRILFVDHAHVVSPLGKGPYPPNSGKWSYPWGIDPKYKGNTLVLILTRNGEVQATYRVVIT
jgi:hypothetical protein